MQASQTNQSAIINRKSAIKRRPASQPELMAALKQAGYTIARFERKGSTLVIHLKPARLKGQDIDFRAIDTCTALKLQARCNLVAAQPDDLLILSVLLPEEKASQTNQSAIINRQSAIQ